LPPPAIDDRCAADELPHVPIEAAELLLDREKAARVRDRGLDLLPVADDAGVREQALDVARPEARDLVWVEAGECAPVTFAFAQDRPPAQAGLRALKQQKLEVLGVLAHGHSPLRVVIELILRIDAFAPRASFDLGGTHDAQLLHERLEV